jgi:hypothetical protein
MKLYQKETGWANMPEIIQARTPFILCIGGRGTGKTYGSVKYLLEQEIPFIYLRRTSSQMELVAKDEFSPIVKIGRDIGMVLTTVPLSKYAAGVYKLNAEGKPAGDPVCLLMALSTMTNARSFDASRIKLILYDEAIPERHERNISHEGDAFLNMYESINRNRELDGEDPVKCVILANANNLEAPILQALNCVRTLDNMRRKHQSYKEDSYIGLTIVLLQDSPISANKRRTALYNLTMGQGDFSDMALDNAFSKDNYTDVSPRPLQEYRSCAAIGSICLYEHKSNHTWYVSERISGSPEMYENTPTDRQRFRKAWFESWQDYFNKRTIFESAPAKVFYKAVMMETLK